MSSSVKKQLDGLEKQIENQIHRLRCSLEHLDFRDTRAASLRHEKKAYEDCLQRLQEARRRFSAE